MTENSAAIEEQQPGGNKWNQQDMRGVVISQGIAQQWSETPFQETATLAISHKTNSIHRRVIVVPKVQGGISPDSYR